jgi:hypothetical protein
MIVVVQFIEVHWTKHSRGGEAAAVRNQVPEAVPFTPPPIDDQRLLFHHLDAREERGFVTRERIAVEPLVDTHSFPCLWVHPRSEDVEVVFGHMTMIGGLPPRKGGPKTVMRLKLGEWGRVAWNGRMQPTYDVEWSYGKFVYNVGVLVAEPTHQLDPTKPHREYRDFANLW